MICSTRKRQNQKPKPIQSTNGPCPTTRKDLSASMRTWFAPRFPPAARPVRYAHSPPSRQEYGALGGNHPAGWRQKLILLLVLTDRARTGSPPNSRNPASCGGRLAVGLTRHDRPGQMGETPPAWRPPPTTRPNVCPNGGRESNAGADPAYLLPPYRSKPEKEKIFPRGC
jgi:hypothetical protein